MRPVIHNVRIALDGKEIIETFSPFGAAKTISVRFLKKWSKLTTQLSRNFYWWKSFSFICNAGSS